MFIAAAGPCRASFAAGPARGAAMKCADRHVVVTGGANGIGRALVQQFHAAGASVVVADLDGPSAQDVADELNQSRPATALGLRADVASERANVDLLRAAEAAFGPIDVFFANAGVGVGAELDTPEAVWELAFDVNVHAHRWAAKHLLPGWLGRGEGYFCSTASAAGLLTQVGSAPYSVTKHAAVAFAEWLSVTYGSRGVRVSCLCPQGVNTKMLRAGDDPTAAGPSSAVVRSAGAILEPADVAVAALRAIETEQFLIAPHPEVLTYWSRKVGDYGRWLAGMRQLQDRFGRSSPVWPSATNSR